MVIFSPTVVVRTWTIQMYFRRLFADPNGSLKLLPYYVKIVGFLQRYDVFFYEGDGGYLIGVVRFKEVILRHGRRHFGKFKRYELQRVYGQWLWRSQSQGSFGTNLYLRTRIKSLQRFRPVTLKFEKFLRVHINYTSFQSFGNNKGNFSVVWFLFP